MLRTLLTFVVVFFHTILCASLSILGGLFNPYSEFVNGVIRLWARVILRTAGIKVEVIGLDRFDHSRPYIYMANHQGNFDILAAMVSIPGTMRFIAKKELFRIPLFAQGMKLAGMISIDRGNSAKARTTLDKTIEKLKHGLSVIVFPEGTRSKEGTIKNFKKGGFILALNSGLPIIPISISGSRHIMQKSSLKLNKGTIRFEFHQPVQSENYSFDQRNNLVNDVRKVILNSFDPEFR